MFRGGSHLKKGEIANAVLDERSLVFIFFIGKEIIRFEIYLISEFKAHPRMSMSN